MSKSGIYFIGKESYCEREIKCISKEEIVDMLSTETDREMVEAVAKAHSDEVYEIIMRPCFNKNDKI